ncbi:MAG TPA: PQQ-binding-like beta-propeller repeat protein [Polyangiaceae bacterium]|nr:PQQ-binding-like beta-propeller repeat protein [Polyangiaceae bacterium]
MTTSTRNATVERDAEVVREYVPFDDRRAIHGVTFDGALVWFARNDEVVAFDPESGQVVRRVPVPAADAGTAFDGERIYQLAKGDILVVDPADGRVLRRFRAPGEGRPSGLAWADGYLFVGDESRIHKIDAETGELIKTLTSDRCVTGVSCVDGALWHGASYDGKPSELRRLAADGTVEEKLRVPVAGISGVEGTRDGGFWCGGERGSLRLVRRKRPV